ncbi:MAG: hypothetical protein JNG88_02780 [Phycisphaerales bacterium]|nr:hypothetical protein [Phycisphaerales bacterium]
MPTSAHTYYINEIEPNDSQDSASRASTGSYYNNYGLYLHGTTSTPNDADYWALNIRLYQWARRVKLTIESERGEHEMSIRGKWQEDGVIDESSDIQILRSSPDGNGRPFIQYFHHAGSVVNTGAVILRVSAASPDARQYRIRVEIFAHPVMNLGAFALGNLGFSTVGLTELDTEFDVVGQTRFAFFCGNDDDDDGGAPQSESWSVQPYGAGFVMAISDFDLVIGHASSPDDARRSGPVLTAPGAVVSTSSASDLDIPFRVFDRNGPHDFVARKREPYGVALAKLIVGEQS